VSDQVETNSPNFLYEIDWAFSRALKVAFNVCLLTSVLIISLLSLALELYSIFEYQEGLSDISKFEIFCFIMVGLLLKRYLAYTKNCKLLWWRKLLTPLIWFGKFVVVMWIVLSFVIAYDVLYKTNYCNYILLSGEHYIQMLAFLCICISLYISVPSKNKRNKLTKVTLEPNERIDPTWDNISLEK